MTCALVVDDDPQNRRDIQDVLEPLVDEVVMAGSVVEARLCLQRRSYDIIVLDLTLEKDEPESGLGVLDYARERYPNVLVIVVTSFGTVERGVLALRRGAFDYIDRNLENVDWAWLLSQRVKLALEYRRTEPLASRRSNL